MCLVTQCKMPHQLLQAQPEHTTMSQFVSVSELSSFPRQLGATRAYHAMVKPVGAICNLDCTYCYYLHKQELLGSESKFRITDEILETHIRQYIEGQDRDEVVFSWQGGEPTLLGAGVLSQRLSNSNRSTRSRTSASRTICRPTARCSTTTGARFSSSTDFWSA